MENEASTISVEPTDVEGHVDPGPTVPHTRLSATTEKREVNNDYFIAYTK